MVLDSRPFLATLSVIVVSELGDKTFFIAAIMAMTHSRVTVFLAAISALIVMTLLSVFLGLTTTVVPRAFTHFASIFLFLVFGVKMLWDARSMSGNEAKEEYEEVQKTLAERGKSAADAAGALAEDGDLSAVMIDSMASDPVTGLIINSQSMSLATRAKRKLMKFISLVFLETFTMTFLAEWGDRSQITTIILGAREDAVSVTAGAVLGHAICTSIAVVAGRFVAQMISARSVTVIGGVMFILFAVSAAIWGDLE